MKKYSDELFCMDIMISLNTSTITVLLRIITPPQLFRSYEASLHTQQALHQVFWVFLYALPPLVFLRAH